MNSLYQQLNQVPAQASPSLPNNLKQIKGMMNAMKSARNPQQFLMNMVQNNPNMKPVMDMLRSGSNPKELFYSMAKEKGLDPNAIIQALGMM